MHLSFLGRPVRTPLKARRRPHEARSRLPKQVAYQPSQEPVEEGQSFNPLDPTLNMNVLDEKTSPRPLSPI